MKAVPGTSELYVDVDWHARAVRVFGRDKSSLLWMTPLASSDFRKYLTLAEWQLEGVPGEALPAGAPVTADATAGTIAFDGQTFTALQSEHLRALLEQAEQALLLGYGWSP